MANQTVDLTNCDREPIHIPGSIQPHGVLLAIEPATFKILQVSNNSRDWLDRAPQELLGKSLSQLLDSQQITAIEECLAGNFESMNPVEIYIQRGSKLFWFDSIAHQSDGLVLLELEPKTAAQKHSFFDFYHQVRGTIAKIQKAPTLREMSQVAVSEVRKITGFDRVMVYQFDPDGAGSVIAEDTDSETPYLDLRYPASDIPQQVRQLYTRNWLRLIPDASYQPAALTPATNPLTGQPLDLSSAVLRSVSPLHLEYLQNMGVTASMSVSLIQDGKLWGLIACHHSSPRYVPYSVRTLCEFVGQVMSLELANKTANEDLDYKIALKSLQTKFVEALSQSENLVDGLVQLESQLLDLVGATGAVVCIGDSLRDGTPERCVCIGNTPPTTALPGLLRWLKPHLQHNLFHTQSLSVLYPEAEAYQAQASGLLALEISKVHHNYILWFRPEVLQTVKWGGNPNKPVEVLAGGTLRLSPRKSFALWQETVSGCSLPWKPCELEIAAELRSSIVGIVLRQADELASMNVELQRSNEELDSFAYIASHDLKEPLRGIHNYANFLMEDYGEILNEDGVAKLQTLVRLTQRMEDLINSLLHFSRLGRAELLRQPVNLDDLIHQVIATLNMARPQNAIEFRIPRPLPAIECDLAQVSELFTNLIGNAIKYNDKPEKWVEVGFIEPDGENDPHPLTFYVRDNGIGISQDYLDQIFQIFRRLHGRDEFGGGTGAGLTIARKIAERHGGRIWVKSIPEEGSTFYFTLTPEPLA
ncbi:MAG: GAF domain-containing protein [Oscillatoriaceae cyanobacterium Prado104]|jgi:light-regulated signal transduction histidine kinase (bacteriophytochrome)|nr:GAF domain-containing protein [Oscillatoriaceae cyanobacterium Prado104]